LRWSSIRRASLSLKKGLLLYLPFDEGSGSITHGVNSNGSITNATWVSGKSGFGKALNFDGSSAYIRVESIFNSFYFAINPGAVGTGKLGAQVTSWVAADTNLSLDEWQFVGFTNKRGGTLDFYLNGVNDGSHTGQGSDANAPHNRISVFAWIKPANDITPLQQIIGRHDTSSWMNIGARNESTHWFDGVIDEVMLFTKVLSAQEVKDLYNYGR